MAQFVSDWRVGRVRNPHLSLSFVDFFLVVSLILFSWIGWFSSASKKFEYHRANEP